MLTKIVYDLPLSPDQTPTPTRFLKNCEEVGLFNELASSFEQEFCKAQDDDHRVKNPARVRMNLYPINHIRIRLLDNFRCSERLYLTYFSAFFLPLRLHLYKHHLK